MLETLDFHRFGFCRSFDCYRGGLAVAKLFHKLGRNWASDPAIVTPNSMFSASFISPWSSISIPTGILTSTYRTNGWPNSNPASTTPSPSLQQSRTPLKRSTYKPRFTGGSRGRKFRGSPDGKDLPVEAGGWIDPVCDERPERYRVHGHWA